jgi:starch synthase
MGRDLKVWFLSPEVAPFAKTGGLADVVGSLPGALRSHGVDAGICLPLYAGVREGGHKLTRALSGIEVPFGRGALACSAWAGETGEGTPVYFIEREDLFDRPNLYGTTSGDYYDNFERFSFFSRAALQLLKEAGLKADVVHCHDWQTGLVPAYLKTLYRADRFYLNTVSVFTIHNLGYQGLFPADKLPLSGIPQTEYHPEGLEYWGNVSLLKAGIVYSDAVTTVSPRYSREIQTPDLGLGMDGVLRKRADTLSGILNGADYSRWDPAVDAYLPARYHAKDLRGKKQDKKLLIQEMGLDEGLSKRPLIGFVSRLSTQKGCDLLLSIGEKMISAEAGLVVLGTGEELLESSLLRMAERHRSRMAVKIGFDEAMAHRIMAGCDLLLVPSRYEPCGLTQMYGLRYGTVPVVRATGGLADTITPFNPITNEGSGFLFEDYAPESLWSALEEAFHLFKKPATWKTLMMNGMKADFSWDRSARAYAAIYRKLLSWDH